MGKVAAIGRDGRFMVNPSNHSESTTHYSKSYISEGPAVTDGLVLYLDADDWGSYPGTKTLTGKFTEYSSGSSHYRTMGRNGVVLLGTSTSWIGYFSADPSSTGRHTIMFDYWSDVAQSNSLVLDNDGIHDNEYNATLSTQKYRQTRFENFTHTTTGNIKFYFRNNVAGNKVYVDNVRFFKSDDTWHDLSGNGNDGTINGATPAIDSTAGLNFDFDGTDDYVAVSATGTKTVEVWFNPDTTSGTNILYGPHANGHDNWLDFSTTVRLFATQSSDTNNFSITGGSISAGNWYQAVAIIDGTTATLYVNGSQVATTTKAFTIGSWSGNASIGRRGSLSQNYANAQIGVVRVYNKALTAAEVLSNYNATKSRFS